MNGECMTFLDTMLAVLWTLMIWDAFSTVGTALGRRARERSEQKKRTGLPIEPKGSWREVK